MAQSNVGRIRQRHGDEVARRQLALTIARCEGKLLHAAAAENIHRSHVYRLVHSLRLWPVVNRARAHRIKTQRSSHVPTD